MLSVGVITGVFLSGCASTRIIHIDGEEFVSCARLCEAPASLGKTRYIGVSDDRAYLEEQNVLTLSGRPRTIVVWTRLEELPDDLAEKLKAGNPPWTNWHGNLKQAERITN